MTASLEEPKVRPKNRDERVPEFLFPDSYEVVNGDVRQVEPMSQYAGFVANRLNSRMILHLESHRTGQTLLDMLFHIPLAEDRSRQRKPDLSYLSFERWPPDRPVPFFGNPIDVVPDLAVEVISPNDEWEDVTAKALEYVRGGVRLVWVISPRIKQIYAYNSNPSPRVYSEHESLDGGDVLPGFAVNVGSLFPPVEMNAPAS